MDELTDPNIGGKASARGAIVSVAKFSDSEEMKHKHLYQEPMWKDSGLTPEEVQEQIGVWVCEIMEKHRSEGYTFISTTYWCLEEMRCNLIGRNRTWFAHILPKLENTWETIQDEIHSDKWLHRAPKKRKRRSDEDAPCYL